MPVNAKSKPRKPVRDRQRPIPSSRQQPKPSKKDYDIGYGKPPRKTQFKKGKSGNPKGRPQNATNYRPFFIELMKMIVQEKATGREVPFRHANLLKLGQKAMEGDLRAIERILKIDDDIAEKERLRAERKARETKEESIDDIPDDFLNDYVQKQIQAQTKRGKND